MHIVKKYYPYFVLSALTLILGILNYKSGTTLTGWDNLHPEFFPTMNLKRTIFSVWQEYQSLGLLGGMGHSADFVRLLFITALSPFGIEDTIRYIITVITLGLGATGAYALARSILKSHTHTKLVSLIVGVFYLLNLATIQIFYVPFEAFSFHFASLPWIILTFINYLQKSDKKNLLLLSLTLFLATPGAYVPTLFVTILISLGIIFPFLIKGKGVKYFKNFISKGWKVAAIIFATNAFWLLPFAYFALTGADVNVNSKINIMATENIYLQNKEFGQIQDVALLKGFWFNNIDVNMDGNFTFMLAPWRVHMDRIIPQVAGYLLFAVMLAGVVSVFLKRDKKLMPFALLFIFAFTMLTTSTPLFEQLNDLFRKIPLFGQAFRFPFTKFSLLASLMYALFLGIGLQALIELLSTHLRKKARYALVTVALTGILVVTFPVFQGKFFYEKEQLKIPAEYSQTFEFFKDQDPNTRIANLPQHTFWGWNFYNWGYGGSGFLWYGIRQPILDRAFDVWSTNSENYFYEIAQAIYAQDQALLKNVLNKYQVNWILLDKNIIYPSAPGSLQYEETESLLANSEYIELVQQYDNIYIYKVNLTNNTSDFMYMEESLPNINSYKWGESDFPHVFTSNYYSSDKEEFDYYLPFRTLHSNRTQDDLEFEMTKSGNTITFSSSVPKGSKDRQVFVPEYSLLERSIATRIEKKVNEDSTVDIVAVPQLPVLKIGSVQSVSEVNEIPLFTLPSNESIVLNVNGVASFTLEKESDYTITQLSLTEDNFITASADTDLLSATVTPSEVIVDQGPLRLTIPSEELKIEVKVQSSTDNYNNFVIDPDALEVRNCDNYRDGKFAPSILNGKLNLQSTNATACTTVYSRNLSHDTGYAVFLESQNISGRPLHFWILDNNSDSAPIDTYLPEKSGKVARTYFVLPPQERFGKGYSLHFDNISLGKERTENTLVSGDISPIPYEYLKAITIVTEGATPSSSSTTTILDSSHPNESLYTSTLSDNNQQSAIRNKQFLILSQSFHPGWSAYEVDKLGWKENALPFLFGKRLNDHFLVNNWSNGWKLTENCSNSDELKIENCKLIIVYLPQYLQYIGFFILTGFTVFLSFTLLKRKPRN